MNLYEKLGVVQSELKAPKNQFNSFGKYKYRSCEDIMEALKPHLKTVGAVVTVNDAIECLNEELFCYATVRFQDNESGETLTTSAAAGIDVHKKGMDKSQAFGAASSYARKYALNGMFLIDDTKDADATNQHGSEDKPQSKPAKKPVLPDERWEIAKKNITGTNPKMKDATIKGLSDYDLSEKQQKELKELTK